MYLSRFSVKNIRSIGEASMEFPKGTEAGWHVILGSNGAGKSSLVRAFALLMMGEKEAYASRQDFARWMRKGQAQSSIEGQISMDSDYDSLTGYGQPAIRAITLEVSFKKSEQPLSDAPDVKFSGKYVARSIWGGGRGWFSASFGPFRRFTGGDQRYDRLFLSNKRLAPHLTALGEDVALTDAMEWLATLYTQGLQDEKNNVASQEMLIYNSVINFLNNSHFLPHGAMVSGIAGKAVLVTDGNGIEISLDQLSDGYRSAMSIVFELIRQMFDLYDKTKMIQAMTTQPGTIQAPGVVAIDEVDAHLHPTWQRDIGRWLTRCFPNVQFIVTTHSPIVCRAVGQDDGTLHGSVWRLPAPGEADSFRRVDDDELNQLVFGDVLDAYSTELFGTDVLRSKAGDDKLERLAELNINALNAPLNAAEEAERRILRRLFPASAGTLSK